MYDLTSIKNIDKKSANYIKFKRARQKCEDFFEGEEVVKLRGTEYLPALPLQDSIMYEGYKKRTRFYNVFKKTIQGFSGMITRKNAILEVEGDYDKDLFNDVTLSGTTLNEYVKTAITEKLKKGFCGSLVDFPKVEGEIISVAEMERYRPNITFFKSENILDYNFEKVNNIVQLSFLKLHYVNVKKVDLFEEQTVDTYILLLLDTMQKEKIGENDEIIVEETQERFYRHVVIEITDSIQTVKTDSFPEMNGKYMERIPFFFHGKDEYPPLNDLVDSNEKHYQLKADHNHVLHYVGLATPVFPGIDPKDPDKPSCLGPERIIYISNPQAKPFFLELEGKSIDKLENELKKIEEDMAFLGAAMIASDTNVNETATKAEIRYTQETSHLVDISEELSESFTQMLKFFLDWSKPSANYVVKYELNKDFNPLKLSAQELTALIQGQMSGQYSKRTLFNVLQKGEIIPEGRDFEEEQDLINNGE